MHFEFMHFELERSDLTTSQNQQYSGGFQSERALQSPCYIKNIQDFLFSDVRVFDSWDIFFSIGKN